LLTHFGLQLELGSTLLGSSFIWVAAVVAGGSFCALFGFRSLQVTVLSALALGGIFVAGLGLLGTSSLFWFFFAFEALLLVSLFLLRISAKADRAEEAALEMLIWALGSSIGLLLSYGWFLASGGSLTSELAALQGFWGGLLALLAFAVKVPM